ncbi:hypothetical protein AAY473_033548 [Plecturocebus cupreus]
MGSRFRKLRGWGLPEREASGAECPEGRTAHGSLEPGIQTENVVKEEELAEWGRHHFTDGESEAQFTDGEVDKSARDSRGLRGSGVGEAGDRAGLGWVQGVRGALPTSLGAAGGSGWFGMDQRANDPQSQPGGVAQFNACEEELGAGGGEQRRRLDSVSGKTESHRRMTWTMSHSCIFDIASYQMTGFHETPGNLITRSIWAPMVAATHTRMHSSSAPPLPGSPVALLTVMLSVLSTNAGSQAGHGNGFRHSAAPSPAVSPPPWEASAAIPQLPCPPLLPLHLPNDPLEHHCQDLMTRCDRSWPCAYLLSTASIIPNMVLMLSIRSRDSTFMAKNIQRKLPWPLPQGWMEFCSFRPGWSAMARSRLTTTSASQVQLILIFVVETVFCYDSQAGLKLLTSGAPPALASQSVGIIENSFNLRLMRHQEVGSELGKNISKHKIRQGYGSFSHLGVSCRGLSFGVACPREPCNPPPVSSHPADRHTASFGAEDSHEHHTLGPRRPSYPSHATSTTATEAVSRKPPVGTLGTAWPTFQFTHPS